LVHALAPEKRQGCQAVRHHVDRVVDLAVLQGLQRQPNVPEVVLHQENLDWMTRKTRVNAVHRSPLHYTTGQWPQVLRARPAPWLTARQRDELMIEPRR